MGQWDVLDYLKERKTQYIRASKIIEDLAYDRNSIFRQLNRLRRYGFVYVRKVTIPCHKDIMYYKYKPS